MGYMRETLSCTELSSTPWSESHRTPGTAVRRTRLTVPVPPDVPKTLARLIGLPRMMDVTAVFRLRSTDDQAVLVMQSCTHNVPYGEHFRIEDIVSLRVAPGGGVAYEKWTKGVWVKHLPWALAPVKTYTEKKIVREAL